MIHLVPFTFDMIRIGLVYLPQIDAYIGSLDPLFGQYTLHGCDLVFRVPLTHMEEVLPPFLRGHSTSLRGHWAFL